MTGGFLTTQTDYIFFVYGLAFVLLAAICITIRHDDPRGLPWAVLGLFGLSHGVCEWMEMLVVPLGDSRLFATIRLGLLAFSFVVLLEFARDGWQRQHGKGPGRWIHVPLLLGALSGALAGGLGMIATIRYALGLPSATWAALTLLCAARTEKAHGTGLILAATVLLGYAITGGVIVPPAHFFPASACNTTVFLEYTGLPVQVVRAILAVLISAALWAHHLRRRRTALDAAEGRGLYHGWQMAFALGAVLAIGWGVTQVVGGHADLDLRESIENHAKAAAAVVDTAAVQALAGASSEAELPTSRHLRQQFQQMLDACPQFRRVHVLVLRPRQEILPVLSVSDARHSLAPRLSGLYLRPPQELFDAFAGNPAVIAYSDADEENPFISGFAPVRDLSTGRVVAVLALDLDARRWRKDLAEFRLMAIAVTLLVSVLLLGFFVVRQRSWQTAEQIAVSENRLAEAQELAHLGSWTYNPQNGHMTWSQELFRILGGNPQAAGATHAAMQRCLMPEDRPQVDAALQGVLRDGCSRELEVRSARPDGSMRHLVWRVRPKRAACGAVVSLIGTIQDITERKRDEENIRRLNATLEQRVRERTSELTDAYAQLESFSYSVSHDLRAPLRHIIGFLDLLKKALLPGLDAQATNCLVEIGAASARMAVLIDDLLAFSQIGRAEMHTDRVDLQRLVREVLHELEPDTAGRRVEWKIGKLPEVVGDAGMLRQVLANLLENALKFSRNRERAEIEVGYFREGRQCAVFVRDNGVGFDPAYADKLFGVFQRLHPQSQFKGTGVGLATVRRIVQRHGGRTWAESAEGKGATFFFTLPGA